MNHIKNILLITTLILTSNVNAFDYKRCMDVNIERSDNSGMKEVLTQVIQLDKAGKSEDVNFETLAYMSTTVNAFYIGFETARTILLSAKFTNKESEINSKDAFKNVSNQYINSIQAYLDLINKSIAFVKNQSVRDDLKSINRMNNALLQKLSPCNY